jgi:ABC-type multidrug transport system permease subunit
MKTGSSQQVYNMRFSLTFFCLLFITLVQQQTIPAYFEDKIIFSCERRPRIYSVLPYWISSWIVYFPQLLFNSFVFGTLVYTMAQYRTGAKFYWFFIFIMCFAAFVGFMICQIVAVLAPSPQTAMSVYPVVVFTMTSVAGYFIFLPDIDNWIGSWAPFISPMRYSFQALILNEFDGNSELPLSKDYIQTYGFDEFDKNVAFSGSAISSALLLVILIYTIRYTKPRRSVF